MIGSTSNRAITYLLSRDTIAVFNCLHGIFIFGGATRYLWTKKPLWWFLMLMGYTMGTQFSRLTPRRHIYMLGVSVVAFILCLIQCFTFGTAQIDTSVTPD